MPGGNVYETTEFLLGYLDESIDTVAESELDAAELTRERLRTLQSKIEKIDRHIAILETLKEKVDESRKRSAENLIREYIYILKLFSEFLKALSEHYKTVINETARDFSKQFGRRLRIARLIKELKQSDVAKEIGIAEITYSTYERGEREPKLYVVQRMARLFGVSADWLLGLSDIRFD